MAFKIAVALGGGAAKGLAHVGVLKGLEEAEIPVDIITGTSIGAVVGATYAFHPVISETIDQLRSYVNSKHFNQARLNFIQESNKEIKKTYYSQFKKFLTNSYFFAISATSSSFITEADFRNSIEHILPKVRIEDCDIPFGLTIANLSSGKIYSLTQGDLIDHVLASAAIPGIFPPVKIGRDYYIDGSWVEPVPVKLAREMGADFVIAVDVAPEMDPDDQEFTGFNVNIRAAEATRLALKAHNLKEADFVVTTNLSDVHWADFLQLDRSVEEGEKQLNRLLPQLRKAIFLKKIKSLFWPW